MHITIEPNQAFSHATLNPRHLLTTALTYVDVDLQQTIQQALDSDDENAMSLLWYEDVWCALEALAPKHCAFSSHEGDASLLGWWQYDEEMCECTECASLVWEDDLLPLFYGGILTHVCGTCYDKHIDPDDGRRRPYDDTDDA